MHSSRSSSGKVSKRPPATKSDWTAAIPAPTRTPALMAEGISETTLEVLLLFSSRFAAMRTKNPMWRTLGNLGILPVILLADTTM
jgi:hypothetical protein